MYAIHACNPRNAWLGNWDEQGKKRTFCTLMSLNRSVSIKPTQPKGKPKVDHKLHACKVGQVLLNQTNNSKDTSALTQ
jgi:hypothetical protein